MKVSIVIPAYNCQPYIKRCIESVKTQTYADWSCIVVDDDSCDKTAQIARETIGKDYRFLLLRHLNNGGLSRTRNTGISVASGDALFFLDADDWIEPDTIEYLVKMAKVYQTAGRIFTPPMIDYSNGRQSKPWNIDMNGFYEADDPIHFSGKLYDTGHSTGCLYVLKNIPGGFSFLIDMPIFEDMLLEMELLMRGVPTVVRNRYCYHYVKRNDSLITSFPYTYEDAGVANANLLKLAAKYNASGEMLSRFQSFLNNAIMSQLARVSNQR